VPTTGEDIQNNQLLVYSLTDSLRDPGSVLVPRLCADFRLPDNVLLGGLVDLPRFLCETPTTTLPAGHFYPDTANPVLNISLDVYRQEDKWAELDLHIPVRPLLQQVSELWGGGGTAQVVVPWSSWSHLVLVDVRTPESVPSSFDIDPTFLRLPSASATRSVLRRAIAKRRPCAPRLRSLSPSSNATVTGTTPVSALCGEPDTLNTLLAADCHPRRVARALARSDSRVTSQTFMSPGVSASDSGTEEMGAGKRSDCGSGSESEHENERMFIRSEAVLPDALQQIDPECLDVAMCGDAILIFQARSRKMCSPSQLTDF